MTSRDEIVEMIVAERARQFNLPGIEFDIKNNPNDWIAIIAHYCANDPVRRPTKPSREVFEDNLIKAAAVILAALEHCEIMEKQHIFC